MADHAAKAFTNETIHVDDQRFIDCEFRRCNLVFSGGERPIFNGCHFDGCEWSFADAAQRTLAYLQFFWKHAPANVVEKIFRDIRGD